jgi:hypothetical protein
VSKKTIGRSKNILAWPFKEYIDKKIDQKYSPEQINGTCKREVVFGSGMKGFISISGRINRVNRLYPSLSDLKKTVKKKRHY